MTNIPEPSHITSLRISVTFGGLLAVILVCLFLSAGTLAWYAGWIFLALFFGFNLWLILWLRKCAPALLSERLFGLRKMGSSRLDKVIVLLVEVLFVVWLVLIPLDAVRFQWTHVPFWLQATGGSLLLIACYFLFLTFRENPYLSPTVRIQDGHRVISTGPYRYIRHPMYSSFILLLLTSTLWLGSWYGLIPGLSIGILLAVRAVKIEEPLLCRDLQGYDQYMNKVKYRLIPYFW